MTATEVEERPVKTADAPLVMAVPLTVPGGDRTTTIEMIEPFSWETGATFEISRYVEPYKWAIVEAGAPVEIRLGDEIVEQTPFPAPLLNVWSIDTLILTWDLLVRA